MWEPFTEPSRRAIVRAQEVAQMFASTYIGTEHIAFALAEADDDVARVLANAFDRDQIREQLGGARGFPKPEMVFTPGAKLVIERAFENARRLGHNYIGVAHLALGILSNEDRPALRAGADLNAMRAELDVIATSDVQPTARWAQIEGSADPHPVTRALLAALRYFPDLGPAGTKVTIAIERPDSGRRAWAWTNGENAQP
jgi:ATP-dependent Clp protease ATP-binding subunit ClpC